MTRVVAYVQMRRAQIAPTGVGKHIIHMVRGISEQPAFDVSIAGSRLDLAFDGSVRRDSPLAGLRVAALPWSSSVMERWWRVTHWPALERWTGAANWVYSPSEAYVPTRRAKLAVTVHDLHAFERDLPWSHTSQHRVFGLKWAALMRPIVKHADLLLTVSEFTKHRLREFLHVDESRVVVVGNGVEDVYFAPAIATDGPMLRDRPYVMVVGGLTPRKGGDLVLNVAEQLQQQRQPIDVWIAGRGDAELEARSRSISNVRLLGYVPDHELAAMLGQSLALLFLSRYEGFGIPALEAMAAGAPVIASKWSALPEIVGDAGDLVDAENAQSIAALLSFLSNSPKRCQELRSKGRARAEQFRWSHCVERLARALRERG